MPSSVGLDGEFAGGELSGVGSPRTPGDGETGSREGQQEAEDSGGRFGGAALQETKAGSVCTRHRPESHSERTVRKEQGKEDIWHLGVFMSYTVLLLNLSL